MKTRILRDWGYGDNSVYESPYTHFEAEMVLDAKGNQFGLVAGYVIPQGGSLTLEAI